MSLESFIYDYYQENMDEKMKEINFLYFESLYLKFKNNLIAKKLILADQSNQSNVVPYAIADESTKEHLTVQDYETLPSGSIDTLAKISLCICKMQAGLGSSVKRADLIAKYSKRKTLGSKGTDLYIDYNGDKLSIAEVQLLLAMDKVEHYKNVSYVNLVNEETEEAVNEIWNNHHPNENKTYSDLFQTSRLGRESELNQLMMPTIDESLSQLSFERKAPCGHGFLGFYKILEIFRTDCLNENQIFAIGNGEDLKSTPDEKITTWIFENNIPITMITTTKLEKDKKGGQLAIVNDEIPFITIVERAQAEKADQLTYFEELGLRSGDGPSLFNTNIVIINQGALKKIFEKFLNIEEEEFLKILTPDLIKNTKEQNGKSFIQLEGAIGSVLLNLDKFFRQTYKQPIVSFLNLAPENREEFFMPIKTRQDFDEIYKP